MAVREMLKHIAVQNKVEGRLEAEDYMDDGSPIKLTIDINDDVSVCLWCLLAKCMQIPRIVSDYTQFMGAHINPPFRVRDFNSLVFTI